MGYKPFLPTVVTAVLLTACGQSQKKIPAAAPDAVKPVFITPATTYDSDDPAIWINKKDSSQSLIIGTDKNTDGALYVYNLEGKLVKKISGLKRPNNVDIAYGLLLNGVPTDIAVATERETNQLRIYRLPDMAPIDNGGIPVFEGEAERGPMGISLYTRAADSAIFAIVSRKSGPATGYLWQYRLSDNGQGQVTGSVIRKFGAYSGKKEIESVAVDNELGYVYYSDEQTGIRKYYADPAKGDAEIALFGQGDFKVDNEGISIYKSGDSTGYILVSDQDTNSFNVYPRTGNQSTLLAKIPVSAINSDGSDVVSVNLGARYPQGLFVAMSTDRTFHFYDWRDIAARIK
ncbi:phytase [Chitinophaga nivalis]|uniref:Phytase n=1 Tax=Chitinophaga nivalis TaxID=2991709 RepID=A0ABT3IFY3_9BACT|nr:phytase [Chitinophaga nivalis]MCW3467438.1 phytase [Chitinophaga nivalis]MCW3482870.1 phytase [Chitinophaga nivalis]